MNINYLYLLMIKQTNNSCGESCIISVFAGAGNRVSVFVTDDNNYVNKKKKKQ